MRRLLRLTLASILLGTFTGSSVRAEVRLPKVFGHNMVLQAHARVPVWGWADPGEEVHVLVGNQLKKTQAGDDGRWRVDLDPLEYGPVRFVVEGSNRIELNNVLVGEVWVCSGQSNMEWPVVRAMNAEKEIAAANYPEIRLFKVAKVVAPKPLEDTEGHWAICTPESVRNFSAVGYFFARELHQRLGVPIGMIQSAWGGTPAEAWTSRQALAADPQLQPILKRWDAILANYDQAFRRYQQALKQWQARARAARQAGKPVPRRPRPPRGPNHPHRPAGLYNGMIKPIVPFAIKGVIWYQGESNASRAYQYRTLFRTMIRDWRRTWAQGDFPFLFVQLANFRARKPEPGESDWAELREAQLLALGEPNTGMAVAIDIGEANDIHPRNKQEVGRRLALAALAIAYGKDVVYSGPIFKRAELEGNKIRLYFDHVDGGLIAKGDELRGFAIAGEDRRFVWAKARIEGDTVVVWSEEVEKPVAVRYGWADNPDCNLYNKAGLPASPFRTDDWPGITVGRLAP